ncbi:hypothetical protein BDV93DRAFT_587710 [Ceratobasidium sp. AG-I]|nr:hypothetical protein BDV93DRAFT_587710 [Ceratobasidium sp. AG-I]
MSVQKSDPNNSFDVYKAWKIAREGLSQSIQTYLSACDALASASYESFLQTGTHEATLLPDALAIDAELSGLVNEEERLRNARFALLASRNRSKGFSKINSLPIEILSSIFLAASPYFKDHGSWSSPAYPAILASVCQLWRQIALDLPSIWTYLHIHLDGSFSVNTRKCAELWSYRSRNFPLRLKMVQYNDNRDPEGLSNDLARPMGLIAPRIQDFYIESSRHVMQIVLCSLINNGKPGSIRSLELFDEYEGPGSEHVLAWDPDVAHLAPSSDRTEELLSSIRDLKLLSAYFPWYSTAYENLASLSLDLEANDLGDAAPTQNEIAKILASSPMLHTLSLNLDSSCRHRQPSVVPILLKSLRSFTLMSYNFRLCLVFLPLIAPGLHALEVMITMHPDATFIEELQSFFTRSVIATQDAESIKAVSWFESIFKGLSQLVSLSLGGCDFVDIGLMLFAHSASKSNPQTIPPWPKLETLELLHCQIENDLLLPLLGMHSIRAFKLYGGTNIPSHVNASDNVKVESMRELVERLSIIPEMKYIPC